MVDRLKPAWVEFGKHVRRLRTQANLSLDRLARLTTYSATYHSKIERAVRAPNVGIVEALDRELGTRGALLRMWRDVERSESGSWYEQPDEYEKEATEIRFFHPFVLPGFLQTESYSRIITSHSVPNIDRESLEKTVDMRKAWRRLLRENEELRLSVVIPEFVLTRLVGGAETMREQLERLVQESQTEGLTLQVLPEGISDFAWTVGAFWLVYIEDQSPIVCTEHCIGGHMTSEARYVRKLESAYNRLQVWALSPNDSLHKIKALRDLL